MKNTITICTVVAVIVGGSAFYGGMLYGKNKGGAPNSAFGQRQIFNANGVDAGGGLRNGTGTARNGVGSGSGDFINGDIIAKDDKSVTVSLRGGGSKIIFLSGSTQIMKSVDATIADLSAGQTVMVTGSANADGSLTAQTIQLRPASPAASSTPPTR